MRKITIRDHLNCKGVYNCKLFDRGQKMIYAVVQMDLYHNKNYKNLYTYDFATKVSRKLTTDNLTGSYLLNDDHSILIQRESKHQGHQTAVYKIDLESGEETLQFSIEHKVKKLFKVDDNRFVFTTVHDNLLDMEQFKDTYSDGAPKSKLYDDYYFFDEVKYRSNDEGVINGQKTRLYSYDQAGDEVVLISNPLFSVSTFDVADNKITYASADLSNPMQVTHRICSYDLTEKTLAVILKAGIYQITDIFGLAGDIVFKGYDTRVTHARENACLYALTGGEVVPIYTDTMDINRAPGSDAKLADGDKFLKIDDRLYCTLCDDSVQNIAAIDIKGNVELITTGLDYIGGFDIRYGKIIVEAMSDVTLKEIYLYDNQGLIKLTKHNDQFLDRVVVAPTETFTFRSNGHDIKGYVIKPVQMDKEKKYPAVLFIHGGPRGLYGPIYQHRMQVMASKGYFVYYTNPHGSASRGNEFSSIFGQHGVIDYQDLMTFTDQVLARYPQVDETRLGVTGHSYGGIMTNHIISKTGRFAAAVSSASLSNFTTKAGATDNGLGASMQVYGDPWENQEWTWNQSPLKYCSQVTTPTLFLHADADYRCFYVESLQMYTGLKRYGVDTEMYLFKNEPHSLQKPRNKLKWLEVLVEWFDRYLKPR